MTADTLVGQQMVETVLARALASNTVAHGYLFAGPRGLGKLAYARRLAAALNCQHPEAGRKLSVGCECPSCNRVVAGIHPDVVQIEPDAGASIKLEQMRELKRSAAFELHLGRCRVVTVNHAHRMTMEAANSILKLLEDPPPNTVFILITPHPELLLGTIRSRCQRLNFRPLPRDDVAEYLKHHHGVEPAAARLWARLSRGNPGQAVGMLEDEELVERRGFLALVVESLSTASDQSLAAWSAAIVDARADEDYLDLMDVMARDLAVLICGGGQDLCHNTDLLDQLRAASAGLTATRALQVLDHIQELREQLRHNVNRLVAWEVLLLNMQHAMRG